MASLYELDQRLQFITNDLVDIDTGEIIQDENTYYQLIDECVMALDEKVENIACYIKSLKSDIEAFKNEETILAKRRKVMENKVDGLNNYLSNFLQSKEIPKFSTPKCSVSFRKSKSVEVDDINKIPQEFTRVKTEISPDKKAIKDAILNGIDINGAKLIEKTSMTIK